MPTRSLLLLINIQSKRGIPLSHEGAARMTSAFLARLGLKAPALAWLKVALAFSNPRPSQSHYLGPGFGLAWLRPWLSYLICHVTSTHTLSLLRNQIQHALIMSSSTPSPSCSSQLSWAS